MSLFRPEVAKKDKNNKEGPWASYIKDKDSNGINHAHNSIINTKYPNKNEKEPAAINRVKFTIIGDRVTEGFIYCTNLINGLHKYRPKDVDAPAIRGVTTPEWPAVLNDLQLRYGGLAFCLQSSVAVLLNDKIIGGEKELKELLETKYSYHISLDYYKESVGEFVRFIRSSGRPCAYMHISIDNEHIGTLIFMLYADLVPYTCENFLRLCKEKRGGYGGTPIHRIVKDGWIQCGGFGLKSTPLDCENFVIPHDKRGVLGMANDGRHVDCSTQFFVLLQPAPWMKHKYVAFGQLIEGEATLKKIESINTWYESPAAEIIIYRSGILNLECHDFIINKGTNEYISGHVEDLNALAELFWEKLMERVFLEAQLRDIARMKEVGGEGAESISEDAESGMRATHRFNRKKEEIEQELQKNSMEVTKPVEENNDYDIEEYEYEPEEDGYKHQSIHTPSLVVKPTKPYYIPLTDVPYVGEVDSNFDLKRFLQGDYCLESDLQKNANKKVVQKRPSFPSELFEIFESSESVSDESLNSEDEKELRKYLKANVDSVSFGGGIIKSIARGAAKYSTFEDSEKSELTDDELRRYRLESADHRYREDRNKKVRIAPSSLTGTRSRPSQRPTGFIRPQDIIDSETEVKRQSVLARLFEEVDDNSEFGPTLKDYKPFAENSRKHLLLTYSSNFRIKSDENTRDKYVRNSMTVKNKSFEQVLNLQHGRKAARKISSDYVKSIDQIEHRLESSIRSVEFAKTRPAISVSEYQMKNKTYQQGLKMLSTSQVTVMQPTKDFEKR